MSTATAENAGTETVAPKGGSSMKGKILIVGFVSMVILAETVLFFFLVPSGDDVARLAEDKLIKSVQAENGAEEEPTEDDNKPMEFNLGEYGVTFIPPGSDRNYRVEFRVFGTVKSKDLERLKTLFAERQGRFRNRMLLEIRNATMDELNENQLGLIQRRILATSNELLDEPILLGVGFEDYQVIQE